MNKNKNDYKVWDILINNINESDSFLYYQYFVIHSYSRIGYLIKTVYKKVRKDKIIFLLFLYNKLFFDLTTIKIPKEEYAIRIRYCEYEFIQIVDLIENKWRRILDKDTSSHCGNNKENLIEIIENDIICV